MCVCIYIYTCLCMYVGTDIIHISTSIHTCILCKKSGFKISVSAMVLISISWVSISDFWYLIQYWPHNIGSYWDIIEIYMMLKILILKPLVDTKILNTDLSKCVYVCVSVCMNVCMLVYVHIYPYTYIQIHTHIHAYKQTYIGTYINTYIYRFIQTYTTHTWIHVCTRAYSMHWHAHVNNFVCRCLCIDTCICMMFLYMCILMYVSIYTYTYIDTKTYIYVHTYETCVIPEEFDAKFSHSNTTSECKIHSVEVDQHYFK